MKTSPQTSDRRIRGWSFHRLALAMVLALIAALGGGTAVASAKPAAAKSPWPKPWAARIVLPDNHAVVTDGTIEVTAQLAPGVKKFRAWVDDKKVTKSFRATEGGQVRDATLRVGKTHGLGYGRHTIYIETSAKAGQTWWAQRRVLVARPGSGLLSSASARHVPGAGVDVKAGVAKPFYKVSMEVDGGPRIELPGSGSRRAHQLHLSADQGLHPGPNLISVRALDGKNGRYEIRRIPVTLPDDVPVAGAGGPHRAQRGQAVRFDGGATKAAHGVHAHYRWTITQAPAGSKARLRHASSPHPVLRPDKIGRYVLKLTVRGDDPGAAVPAAGARAVASSVEGAGEAEAGTMEVASDSSVTTLDATPKSGPMGVPLETISGSGVTVGETHYAQSNAADGLQLVVLSRSTLALQANTPFPITEQGAAELLSAVQAASKASLVIIARSSDSASVSGAAAAASNLNKALAAIGVSAVSQKVLTGNESCQQTAPCSAFSAVGVPGLPAGQGYVNAGLGSLGGHPSGDLHGYLQEDLTGDGYTFTPNDRVVFDTGDPTAEQAVVTVGSNEEGSPLPLEKFVSDPESPAGFFVVVLSAGNLGQISYKNSQGYTETGQAVERQYGDIPTELKEMHEFLSQWEGNQNALVIVRSIGSVKRVDTPAWNQVANDLQQLGGSALYFNTLNGSNDNYYAQVGPAGTPGYPSPWTQVATQVRSGTGRLTGLLGYNNLGQLYPAEATPPAAIESSRPLTATLAGLISLPPTGWPEEKYGAAEKAAEGCIAANIEHLGGFRTPFYLNYTNTNLSNEWGHYESKLENMTFAGLSSKSRCESITEPAFKDVKAQLEEEWAAIGSVSTLFTNLHNALDQSTSGLQLASIATEVSKSLSASAAKASVHLNAAAIISDAMWAISGALDDETTSDALNVTAGLLAMASELAKGPEGATEETDTTVQNFAQRLSQQFTTEAEGLVRSQEIVLSDWNKLRIAGINAKNLKDSTADWFWEPKTTDNAIDKLMLAARRTTYETLFPAAYSLYRLRAGTGTLPTNPAQYECAGLVNSSTFFPYTPFAGIEQYGSVDLVNAAGEAEDWVYAEPDTGEPVSFLEQYKGKAKVPTATLLGALFGPPKSGDLYQQANTPLFNGAQFAIEAYDNGTSNTVNVTHAHVRLSVSQTNLQCEADK